jgi:hypothetical protein
LKRWRAADEGSGDLEEVVVQLDRCSSADAKVRRDRGDELGPQYSLCVGLFLTLWDSEDERACAEEPAVGQLQSSLGMGVDDVVEGVKQVDLVAADSFLQSGKDVFSPTFMGENEDLTWLGAAAQTTITVVPK